MNLSYQTLKFREMCSSKTPVSYKSKSKSKNFVVNRDKRWYYRLIPRSGVSSFTRKSTSGQGYFRCLTDEHPQETLEHKVVVGFEFLRDDGRTSRKFAAFDSYIELYKYQNVIEKEKKNFYEIIFGEFPQKPHFDIDIKETDIEKCVDIDELAESVKDNLIECVIDVCESVGVKLNISNDILLYQSHTNHTHDTQKRSFHLVVHHYCHADNRQALGFYEKVTERMNKEYAIYVDHSVYSSKQNFRLCEHQKLYSGRPKILKNPMIYHGKSIDHVFDIDFNYEYKIDPEKAKELLKLETLKESLVSWTADCEYLPSFQSEEERRKKNSYDEMGDLSPETINEAELLISRGNFPFVVRDVKGSIISLKRLKPSFCKICERVHEHENPYLLVIDDNVYFYCRRNTDKNLPLGKININLGGVNEFLEEKTDSEETELPDTPKLIVEEKRSDALDMIKQSNLTSERPNEDTLAAEKISRWRDHIKNTKDQKLLANLPEI